MTDVCHPGGANRFCGDWRRTAFTSNPAVANRLSRLCLNVIDRLQTRVTLGQGGLRADRPTPRSTSAVFLHIHLAQERCR